MTDLEIKESGIIEILKLQGISAENKYVQSYLKKLELAEDGTLFGPVREKKVYEPNIVLNHAMTVGYYALRFIACEYKQYFDFVGQGILVPENDTPGYGYKMLKNYFEHAKNILTSSKYIEGDEKLPEQFSLDIYSNPKENIINDFSFLLSYLLKNNSWIDGIFKHDFEYESVNGRSLKIPESLRIRLVPHRGFIPSSTDSSDITQREYEAFFGRDAMNILGITDEKMMWYWRNVYSPKAPECRNEIPETPRIKTRKSIR